MHSLTYLILNELAGKAYIYFKDVCPEKGNKKEDLFDELLNLNLFSVYINKSEKIKTVSFLSCVEKKFLWLYV